MERVRDLNLYDRVGWLAMGDHRQSLAWTPQGVEPEPEEDLPRAIIFRNRFVNTLSTLELLQ